MGRKWAYYNEFDRFAAAWLRELIEAGLIADGEVDERSITDVTADDVRGFVQCHFFAGIGGWSYALRLAGWSDDRPVWTGSCPCQPWSVAGLGAGCHDSRDLWPTWCGLIRQCRPARVFGEQVDSAAGRLWLDIVHDNLEHAGYAVGAVGVPACAVGAPHARARIWFVADADGEGLPMGNERESHPGPTRPFAWGEFERVHAARAWRTWQAESAIPVFTDGIPSRMATTRGYGNAIVPQVAAEVIGAFMEIELLTRAGEPETTVVV